MDTFKAFTAKSKDGLVSVLYSNCGISQAYIPIPGGTHPPVHNYTAIWDTGATGTVITKKVVDQLGLKPIGKIKSYHANGFTIANQYVVNLLLPNEVGFSTLKVTESGLTGMDVLIGMDIITQGDFSITNKAGKTTFSFRIPSIVEIDYTKEANDIEKAKLAHVRPNDTCPCGSKKKFKHCHGGQSR